MRSLYSIIILLGPQAITSSQDLKWRFISGEPASFTTSRLMLGQRWGPKARLRVVPDIKHVGPARKRSSGVINKKAKSMTVRAMNPKTNSWRPMGQDRAPLTRSEFAAHADEPSLFIWSGVTEECSYSSGGYHDLKSSQGRSIPDAPVLVGRPAGPSLCSWAGMKGGYVLGDGLIFHTKD